MRYRAAQGSAERDLDVVVACPLGHFDSLAGCRALAAVEAEPAWEEVPRYSFGAVFLDRSDIALSELVGGSEISNNWQA